MRYALNDDQATFFTVLEQMTTSGDAQFHNAEGWGRFEWAAELDATIEANGFYDAAAEASLGPVAAAAMIYRLAQLPVAVECAASALLRPQIAPDLPRPIAVVDGASGPAIRFLPVAKSVVRITDDAIYTAPLPPGAATAVDSLFAYPMGTLGDMVLDWSPIDCDAPLVLDRWRVAVAAELCGALNGALDSVLEHVKSREQFGRPLGSFQGVQHRLASAAVQIEAARWLTLKAAQRIDRMDAAAALGYAQNVATKIGYDLHQFMGAMGLTLEHPLHRWTYRVRLLRSLRGGATGSFRELADQRWGAE